MALLILLPFLMLLLFGLVWLSCLISCISNTELDSNTKMIWLLALIFIAPIGCLLYLLIGPRKAKGQQFVVQQVSSSQTKNASEVSNTEGTRQNESTESMPTVTTYTLTPIQQPSSRSRGALVLASALIVMGVIAIPSLGRKTSPFKTKYRTSYASSSEHMQPYQKGYVPNQQSASIARNIATMQEVLFVDTSSYLTCYHTNECNKLFNKTLHKEAIPAGYSAMIVAQMKNGEKGFTIELWNNSKKDTYVQWDSFQSGIVG